MLFTWSSKQRRETTDLVIPEPYPVVCYRECEYVVHKRLALRVILRRGKDLQRKKKKTHNLIEQAFYTL